MSSPSDSEVSFSSQTPFTTPCASPPQKHSRRTSVSVLASISFEEWDFDFRIPSELHIRTAQLIDQYLRLLSSSSSDSENVPKSALGLIVRFLQFVTEGRGHILDPAILTIVLVAFEQRYLINVDIHCLATSSSDNIDIVRIYFTACALTNHDHDGRTPALFRAADSGRACIYTIFGGQGNTALYFEDIRKVHETYSSLVADFFTASAELFSSLSRDRRCGTVFAAGEFDLLRWIQKSDTMPETRILVSTPYSFPLIGLLQLLNYMVACKAIGETPCTFRRYLSGTSGHSQGIIAAVVTASADSWDSFDTIARAALTTLFWIGVRSQQVYPQEVLAPATIKDALEHGEGVPSPMLSVRDISQSQLQRYINQTNSYFPEDERVSIGLINNAQHFVVSGPPMSLHGLNVKLRQVTAAPGDDQARIPFSKRKPVFPHSFLPITVPFHSKYLTEATEMILDDVKDIQIQGRSLRISVFHPSTGEDLSRLPKNIVPALVRMITQEMVDWPAATKFTDATHILEFGPGGASGIGMLTNRNKDGRGVRVIFADRLDGISTSVGFRDELFTRNSDEVIYGCDWAKTFAPRLLQTPAGTIVDTKLSKVLGVPPLIIAGMTPTTVHWDFVAAAMSAGYHIELAAGGYHKSEDLETAILKLERAIPIGRGITVNVIYASPQAIAWQVPLLANLRSQGVPIDGLTVGAGVPSPEIAENYIKTIGLKHISFKPGSIASIEAVINIAKANSAFPVILQWTGGRAGGHHSFEDFHQPILATYSSIRQCANLILVAGSGFGGADDTYPYMTGSWSTKFGYPRMPFDGCLFGSRLMVAKETHTSYATKLAIVNTPGLADNEWEKTYKPEGAGGLVTVISEMGEPVHMLATRGAKFWSAMDQMVFKLPSALRVEALKKHQKFIVKKLNADYQRVWFGQDSAGRPVELDDMTYADVVSRMLELLTWKRDGRWDWIDPSWEKFANDFVTRIEERFCKSRRSNVLGITTNAGPSILIKPVLSTYPMAREQLMSTQDVHYFLKLCHRRGQKPLPFIPVLDENFETYFKKDSLWQSEDLEAVVGQDVGRTCILHGPVAAKHSVAADETVKTIMDDINHGHIQRLVQEEYGGLVAVVPQASLSWTRRGSKAATLDALSHIQKWTVSETEDTHIYRVPEKSKLPAPDSWLHLLAGGSRNWREILFLSPTIMRGTRYQPNPIQAIFIPLPGHIVEISNPNSTTNGSVALKKQCPSSGEFIAIASVEFRGKENKVLLCLWSRNSPASRSIALALRFGFNPKIGVTPISENLRGKMETVRRFYWQIWFGGDEYDETSDISRVFTSDAVVVTRESVRNFVHSVGYSGESSVGRAGKEVMAPIDYAIVVAWRAITKPLFCESLDGNLLDLVHLSNEFNAIPGAAPLKVGDTVVTISLVTAAVNQDSGRMVEVSGTIIRDNKPVIEIISRFLFRGSFSDYQGTFETKREIPRAVCLKRHKDVAVLLSKPWIQLDLEDPGKELLGKTLEFRLSSTNYFKDRNTFDITNTTGEIRTQCPSHNSIKIGIVKYKRGNCPNSVVVDYLQRHGLPIDQPVPLKNSILIKNEDQQHHTLVAPASNEAYADASGDTNPIHVSHVFAQYVNLPGTITHGMWTSAAVRNLLEVADDHAGRVCSWKVKFVGMVVPSDTLHINFNHTAMIEGRKLIKVEVRKASTDELVMTGDSEVEQPVTAYIFTGQGSQRKGMAMDLRASSPVARAVWDRADSYFMATYGFTLTHIVQNDPKELTIHFGGTKGKLIRQNYMSLTQEATLPSGCTTTVRLLPEITARSKFYTFRSPLGLLSATQFTQPALTLMEIARFEDMKSRGLISSTACFAGHSLGEYAALAALGGGTLPIEGPAALTFYRGLTMQMNVSRDLHGRSQYSMCAVNPSKVPSFNEEGLKEVVEAIGETTGQLLEIVNWNVRDAQYICAGEIRALSLLTDMCNHLIAQRIAYPTISAHQLISLIRTLAATSSPNYERGPATVPLHQIDVPFHSSFLAPNIASYRKFLQRMIKGEKVDVGKLVGKWVPNITGRVFGVERSDWESLEGVTGSVRVGEVLANWEGYCERRKEEVV